MFKIIHLNSKLRELFKDGFFFGVTDTKKVGKWTFVELITDKKANYKKLRLQI